MPFRPFGLNRMPTSAIMLSVSGLAVVGMALASPGALLERELQQALSATPVHTAAAQPAEAKGKKAAQLSGSEEFWLSHFAGDHHGQNIVPAVAIGDSITVNTGDAKRTLRVTGVKEIPANQATRIDTSGRTTRVFVITCEEAGRPGSDTVKFFMKMDGGTAEVASKPNRSL
jgi:hypothetical protein